MQLFYCTDISADSIILDPEESRHAVRVMRLKAGDELYVTDGHGLVVRAGIVVADEKGCTLQPLSRAMDEPAPADLLLGVAPTKNPSRTEWLVEKAVEMGVARIFLLQGDHSERVFMKTDRLERIAVSAMKQSLHAYLSEIVPPMTVHEFITGPYNPDGAQCFIAHCDAGQARTPLADVLQPRRTTVVLIGPEGDFSPEEIALAREHGYQPVSLGPSRLRTETAALYAVAAFNFVNDASAHSTAARKNVGKTI